MSGYACFDPAAEDRDRLFELRLRVSKSALDLPAGVWPRSHGQLFERRLSVAVVVVRGHDRGSGERRRQDADGVRRREPVRLALLGVGESEVERHPNQPRPLRRGHHRPRGCRARRTRVECRKGLRFGRNGWRAPERTEKRPVHREAATVGTEWIRISHRPPSASVPLPPNPRTGALSTRGLAGWFALLRRPRVPPEQFDTAVGRHAKEVLEALAFRVLGPKPLPAVDQRFGVGHQEPDRDGVVLAALVDVDRDVGHVDPEESGVRARRIGIDPRPNLDSGEDPPAPRCGGCGAFRAATVARARRAVAFMGSSPEQRAIGKGSGRPGYRLRVGPPASSDSCGGPRSASAPRTARLSEVPGAVGRRPARAPSRVHCYRFRQVFAPIGLAFRCLHNAAPAIHVGADHHKGRARGGRDELAARAASRQSMQEFLRCELERIASRPSLYAWLRQCASARKQRRRASGPPAFCVPATRIRT